jgi:hypothetical protein
MTTTYTQHEIENIAIDTTVNELNGTVEEKIILRQKLEDFRTFNNMMEKLYGNK